LLSYYTLLNK